MSIGIFQFAIWVPLVPPKPSGNVSSPTDGVITVTWNSLENTTYAISITKSDNSDVLMETNVGNRLSFSTTLPTGTYNVRLRCYDNGNRPSATWSAQVQIQPKILESYTYDLLGQVLSSKDSRGWQTNYEYGLHGVIKESCKHESGTQSTLADIEYQYDVLGNLRKQTWVGTSKVIDFKYDDAGRLVKKYYDGNSSDYTAYEYDANNQITNARRASVNPNYVVNTTNTYDNRKRLTSTTT